MSLHSALVNAGGVISEHSPAILVGAGVIGFVACAVLASRATLKVNDIMEESKEQEEKIKTYEPDEEHTDEYTEEDREKDLKLNTMQTRLKIVKNYALPVGIGIASTAAILVGFKVLNGRYLTSVAAYGVLEKAYEGYRKRIIEKGGLDLDRYGRTGIWTETETRTVEKVVGQDKKGNDIIETVEETETRDVILDQATEMPFRRLIGPGDYLYDKMGGDMTLIAAQVQAYQNAAQQLYEAGEPVHVNDWCYKQIFGMDSEKLNDLGQLFGWCKRDKEAEAVGDHCVDFRFTTVWDDSMDGTHKMLYGCIDPNCSLISYANINRVNKKNRVHGILTERNER